MRISKISVKGLFGMFDHEIPLNQESRITIIHGPNGVGKTVLMQMVDGLFSFNYDMLYQPYSDFWVEFLEGYYIRVLKISGDLYFEYYEGSNAASELDNLHGFRSFALRRLSGRAVYDRLMDEFPDFRHITWNRKSYWLENKSPKIYMRGMYESKINEDTFSNNRKFHDAVYGPTPDWFFALLLGTATNFFNTERLDANMFNRDFLRSMNTNIGMEYDSPEFDNWFEYGLSVIEELETKFSDLLDGELYWAIDALEKLDDLYTLAKEEAKVEIPGIWDSSNSESRFSERRRELDLMLREFEQKYQDVDNLQAILLLQKILNERFLFKELRLTTKSPTTGNPGFKLLSQDGSPISMEKLSSGEQQLLVLYYQLLLEVEPDTLVMIDEPELSMNVVWQRNFLKDLERIIELRKFDVLIATHSPEVIYDKWDWTVALGEKVDD